MNGDTYDALVIGAGFAGLTAARDLAKDGKRVLIIEARDRIGGRTWYRPFADTAYSVEMGGGWVDPVFNVALMREIERYGIVLAETPVGESQVAVLDGQRYDSIYPLSVEDVLGLERALFPILEAARRIDPTVPLDRQDAADLDVPLDEYLDALDLPLRVRRIAGAWIRTNAGCEEADVSALHLLSWIPSLNGSAITVAHFPSHRFAEGSARLYQALLADAACDVVLETPVESVTQTVERVEVRARSGETFRGRAAVVAVPLNCWSDIAFEPALSPAKRAGAATGQSGTTNKLWALTTGLPRKLQAIGDRAMAIDTFTAQLQVDEGDLVVGFSTRERELDVTDPAAVETALQAFVPSARVLKVDSHDWVADPYAKGTWCAAPAGLLSKHAAGLAEDEGRLIFAGSDLAHAFRGWITGAVESGGAAASRLSLRLAA
jgi:monoamine oxidase